MADEAGKKEFYKNRIAFCLKMLPVSVKREDDLFSVVRNLHSTIQGIIDLLEILTDTQKLP